MTELKNFNKEDIELLKKEGTKVKLLPNILENEIIPEAFGEVICDDDRGDIEEYGCVCIEVYPKYKRDSNDDLIREVPILKEAIIIIK